MPRRWRGLGQGDERVAKGREDTAEIRVQKLSDGRCGHWRWTWTNFLESNKLKAENGGGLIEKLRARVGGSRGECFDLRDKGGI